MQKVVLPNGVEVVYHDDKTVSVERDGLRLRSLVIVLAHFLALIGAHLEVVARRKSRTSKHLTLTASNHPIGQFIELIVRMWRISFGEQLVLGHPISFRPGMDLWFGRQLRVTATDAPNSQFRLDEPLIIEQRDGGALRVSESDWHEMLMSAALELLCPMWQRVGKPREVSSAALRNPGWEMMAQALVHNSWVMWLAWLFLTPFLWIREIWQRFRLASDTTCFAAQLQSGLSGMIEQVKELQQLAESACAAQADAEASAVAIRQTLARDQQTLQAQREELTAASETVKGEVARITATHNTLVAELQRQLAEKGDAIAELELKGEQLLARNAELQSLVTNYEEALRQLPPQS